MKPIVKKKLTIFSPQGFLDGGNAHFVITPQDVTAAGNTKSELVLVSLKKIIFFNKRGLATVLEALNKISSQNGAAIGFCDYDNKKYKMISDMYGGHIPFSLFDTEQIATLFSGNISGKNPEDCTILVFNENKEQTNQIVMELYERGYKPTVAKDKDDYNTKKATHEFTLRYTYLGSIERAIQIHIKDNVIIYTLKDFLDSSLADNFDMEHHENALKIGFAYFLFEAKDVVSTNIHAVNFIAKLSTAGAEYGATIAASGLNASNMTDAFKQDLEDAGVLLYNQLGDFFKDDEIFGEDGGGALSGKKPRHITKKIVELLPLVMQISTKTIESMTHKNLTRKETKITPLKLEKTENLLAVAIAFYGHVEGMIIFAFDKMIAKKACSILLDEDTSDTTLEGAIGELINIIASRLVQELKRKGLKANITMPRAYKDAKELLEHKKGTKGAQVDFEIDGKQVTLFLTK